MRQRNTAKATDSVRQVSLVCVAAVAVVLALNALTLVPETAEAGDGLKIVKGKVYDYSLLNTIAGADVTVVIKDAGDSSVIASLTDTTNETGWYSVTFDFFSPWSIGDIIDVTAEYDTYQNSNSTTITSAQDYPIQYVNVTLELLIPEFGSGLVFVVVGTAGIMIAVAASVRRRKS